MTPREGRRSKSGARRGAVLAAAVLVAGLVPLGVGGAPATAGGSVVAAGPVIAGDPSTMDGPLAVEEPAAAGVAPPRLLDGFEGETPFATPPAAGIYPWGAHTRDRPTLSLQRRADAPEGHAVLHGRYEISTRGGFTRNVSNDDAPQDWSTHRGLRFWWYGQNDVPLPAGTGKRIRIDIKDGGADAEASELWTTSFTDDWQGWHLVEIPFSTLRYRTDYQPVGGIDQILDLTRVWGYAVTLPSGGKAQFAMDGVALYGTPDPELRASVRTDAAVYPVNEGDTAKVRISLVTAGHRPLAKPVTVRYETGGGSAQDGSDYTPVSGSFTFPVGASSGSSRTVTVRTAGNGRAETAETVPFTMRVHGARPPADQPKIAINAHDLPYLDPGRPVGERVKDLLSRMTLEEKVGQMTQAERSALRSQDDISTYALGSLLSGGGSAPTPNNPQGWARMVNSYQLRAQQTRLQVPLLYGADAVHGHNNLHGATIMPHNIGLGATRDPALVQRTGEVTARETRATGVAWTFAPCLCVVRDDRWGRSYESFGEDPALVESMETVIQGLQGRVDGRDLADGDRVLATAKHYVGDGGTVYGSSTTGSYTIDQGVTTVTRDVLRRVHLAPYAEAVRRGVGTVMPSFSSVDLTDDGKGPVKMHGNDELINGELKGRMGFPGLVVSDWQGIDQLPGDYPSDVRTSINAGLDMIMVPDAYQEFVRTLLDEVRAGRVDEARIDDAVSRILRTKFQLGLFEKPYADTTHADTIGSAQHRAVARQAVAGSQVLLKNRGGLLPLPADSKVYLAGSNADDLGNQAGGWTVTWQGGSGRTTVGTTIREGIHQVAPRASVTYSKDASAPTRGHDVGVVVVGETPYAEGIGDVGNEHDMWLGKADQRAVDTVCGAMKCVVLVVSGRPQLLGDQLRSIDALVASWLPGTEGAGVADVLFGRRPFTGRNPVSWPRTIDQQPINVGDERYDPEFPYGWGLTTEHQVRAALSQAGVGRRALAVRDWDRHPRQVFRSLWRAAAILQHTPHSWRERNAVVGAARHLAQRAVVAHDAQSATAKLTADAEHRLLTGDVVGAVSLLAEAHRTAVG
ncbi:glycosyl hydrolase [Wenjunlia vitaminophila]|uniref:beta-glucosidase n=1 Tax=Wenjunlia vitaminophila TaxID=76728 RepID=A0A0T6LXA9_WENVI|nr:glycosyl hydrolase [Wenjunlia vitaminophila]